MTHNSTDNMTHLRGDTCPVWCGGDHRIQRGVVDGRQTHPEDAGVFHHSGLIDSWRPMDGDTNTKSDPIEVQIEGKRHDQEEDWPDVVTATNVSPGFLASVELQVADARRLGEALIKACDLAEPLAED